MADSTAPAAATTPLLAPPATVDQPRAPAAGEMDALRGLLPAGDDAAPLAIVAAMWANQAASGAAVAARWVRGEGSRAVVLAEQASYAAFVAMGLLLPLAYQRLAHRFNVAHAAPPAQQARERRSVPARVGLGQDGRLTPGPLLVILFCCMLMAVHWLVPAKGSCFEKVSTGLGDLGTIFASVTLCWVILPNLAIILLRAPAN
ncbi:hypothetical protein SETIT_6G146200v2 [Setaria italica]|uniref:Uncharacterized protein n=2 Tax=Setaria TaxID=4554 RepID=A0A368RLM6_SETIT|nr:uncharacterized protein LOC117862112 [Setaria viridis]RCV31061.1 hypothetical protein SETIT_6G146200v2 [Setaria italica]TKW10276.1 hypothetical protein SEVIR_6G152000v2 [Setaria viridis]